MVAPGPGVSWPNQGRFRRKLRSPRPRYSFARPPGSASMSCDGGLGSTTTDVRLPIEQLPGAAAPQIPLEEPGFLTEIRLGVDSASVPRSDCEVWLPQSPSAPNVTAQAPESEPQSRWTRKQT